jgi:hypothetical protein
MAADFSNFPAWSLFEKNKESFLPGNRCPLTLPFRRDFNRPTLCVEREGG